MAFNFQKNYPLNSEESLQRYKTFKQKLAKIKEHNEDIKNSWKMGLNQFSDLTEVEFRTKELTQISTKSNIVPKDKLKVRGFYEIMTMVSKDDGIPRSWDPIDWSRYCGKVFNQGGCGSCYAFAMVNTIECQYNIKFGTLPELSRQQVVDCSTLSNGCHGGDIGGVAFYAHSVGLMNASDYPYIEDKGECKFDSRKAKNYVDAFERQSKNFPEELKTNPFLSSNSVYDLLSRGPLAVVVDAGGFQDYKSGVFQLHDCVQLNHAVMIIGFGIDRASNKRYWLVKNSLDTWWGENGYARAEVVDDKQYNCYLHSMAIRPFIE